MSIPQREKKSSPLKRIGKKAVKKIGTTAKSMFQRILTLAMPLITAIIVNNIESIAEGIMTFYENNKGIFDGIGKAVSVLGKGFMMLVNFISGMEDNKDAKKMKELDSSITNLKGHLDKIEPLKKLGEKLSSESDKAASRAFITNLVDIPSIPSCFASSLKSLISTFLTRPFSIIASPL